MSFSYTPRAGFSEEFPTTPDASFSEEFVLHCSCYVLVRSLSYTPRAGFSEDFYLFIYLHSASRV